MFYNLPTYLVFRSKGLLGRKGTDSRTIHSVRIGPFCFFVELSAYSLFLQIMR